MRMHYDVLASATQSDFVFDDGYIPMTKYGGL